ncbi:MAG: bacterial Ig-like domain-containing protein [Mycoplasmatota bacterium]
MKWQSGGDAKTIYLYTEELDLENVYLLGADESKVYVTNSMISGYDKKEVGIQEVIVSYNGVSFSYEVEVVYGY